MIDNNGPEKPVALPVEESNAQKQEPVTNNSSKTPLRRVGLILNVSG